MLTPASAPTGPSSQVINSFSPFRWLYPTSIEENMKKVNSIFVWWFSYSYLNKVEEKKGGIVNRGRTEIPSGATRLKDDTQHMKDN
jgi:hypothetical protein